jgi:dTDP-4-amino-4,6-dideoxygalactose transaminase
VELALNANKHEQNRKERVPMSAPDITETERKAVLDVLHTPRLSMGPAVEAFEEALAEHVGVRHAIAVSSGTTGLHLCVRAAGIREGDLVITTPFSFVASANVLLYERATPVFVDVDPRTGNLDPELVRATLEDLSEGGQAAQSRLPRRGPRSADRPKALLSVDVFGQPADYDSLSSLVSEHDLIIIEDSCEALGAMYKGRPAGTFGEAAVFAFYPNKQITTGEGGMVVTDNEDWAGLIRAMRNQGRAPGDTWLDHTHLGYNYRLGEMSAALGVVQMGRLEELLGKRETVAAWYDERLAEVPGAEPMEILPSTTRMSWFVYVIRLGQHLEREAVSEAMAQDGVPSRPYFTPIHLQPYFVERFGYSPGDMPITEELSRRCLALPFSSLMTESQVDIVCGALQQALARNAPQSKPSSKV